MANTLAPFGFRHVGFLSGGSPDYQLAERPIQSSYATNIFFGDPVVKSSATPYVILATGTATTLEGIFQGCWYIPTGGGPPQYSPWWPSAGGKVDATALIANAPNSLFLALGNGSVISSAY